MTKIVKYNMIHVGILQGTQLQSSYGLESWSTLPTAGFLTAWPQSNCVYHAMLLYLAMLTTFHGILWNKSYNKNNGTNNLQ
jgi:hypothetical protein